MRDTGQEHRAFMAILLAMAVLFAWNYMFPMSPPSPVDPADPEGAQVSSATDAAAQDPTGSSPFGTAPPGPADGLSSTGASLGTLDGTLFGNETLLDMDTEPIVRQQVTVTTDDLSLTFDSQGARLTSVVLRRFSEGDTPGVELLDQDGPGALSSIVVRGNQPYPLESHDYRLVSDLQDAAGRRLVWELAVDGLTLRKTFVIPPRGYLIEASHELLNDSLGLSAWGLSWAGGMRVTEEQMGKNRGAYFHATVMAEGEVKRKDPNSARKGPLEYPGHTYFVGVQNKYFLGAIVPRGEHQGPARLWRIDRGFENEAAMAAEILVTRTPGLAANRVDYDIYIGPLDYAGLKETGLGLEDAVDLGASWIRPLSKLILGLLIWLHGVIPNYGLTIILFSAAMNLLFFPLTYKSTKSMRDMSALKPQLDALKEKHQDDKQKMSEATMKLYKEAGVNPLGGCLPILLQMPIFFALYAVLFHTIELRQEPFVLWIRDLSQPDVVFDLPFSLPMIGSGICLLPIIMGITSFFQSKQTMVDPNQKAMLYMMPVMMTFIFFTMPSGLVLYWLTSNLFTIGTKFFMKPSKNLVTPDGAVLSAGDDDDDEPKKNGGSKRSGKRSRKRSARAAAK